MTISATEGLEARDNLLWIAARWPDLKARLLGGGGDPFAVRVSGSTSPPLVLDVYVSDLMREIEDEARMLAHVLVDEAKVSVEEWEEVAGARVLVAREYPWEPRTSAMPELLVEVAGHWGHWTSGDDRTALAFMDWAHEHAEKVRSTLERPAPPSYMGDCPTRYDVGGCGGSLYLREGKATMQCGECGVATSLESQREYLAKMMAGRLYGQTEMRFALLRLGYDIPLKTVQSWAQRIRGKEPRMPEVEDGLHRFATAKVLAEEWAARHAA